MPTRRFLYAAAGLSLLAGCATNQVQPPKNELNTASQAVTRARHADSYEFAAFEMTNADRKLERAQVLANSKKDKDRLEARRLAEQATLDARLAEAKTRLAQEQATRDQMAAAVDTLRRQSEQNAGGTP